MAFDAFLKLDGIPGESTADGHKDEIEILSFSFGEANFGTASSGGGGGAGKVQMQDFHFTMAMSQASPKAFLACATGQHIKQGTLTVRKAGEKAADFLKITLDEVLVSSFQAAGQGTGTDLPMEELSLNFAKIQISYARQKPDGSLDTPIVVSFDRKTNTAG